jgi:HD domain
VSAADTPDRTNRWGRSHRTIRPGVERRVSVVGVAYRACVHVQVARSLARALLDDPDLTRRRAHVCGVARRAGELAGLLRLDGEATELLVAAAWLHDCGYSPLIATGFHPVDGARYLRRFGAPELLCRLVANHSGAAFEAEVRGRAAELAEFPAVGGVLDDALTCADMQTSPTGSPMSVHARVTEILSRYQPRDPVHTAVSRSAPRLIAAVTRTEARVERTHLRQRAS